MSATDLQDKRALISSGTSGMGIAVALSMAEKGPALAPTVDTGEADFDGLFQINVKVPFFLVAALAPSIAVRGGGSTTDAPTSICRSMTDNRW